ncbi:MAG: hypothetical protein QXT38_04500, partial [Candidatus Aenigmatarchaeota archaeon]
MNRFYKLLWFELIFLILNANITKSQILNFFEDFEYNLIEDLIKAGWVITDTSYIEVINGTIILKNDCEKTSWPRFYFNNSVISNSWYVKSRGKWISGPYGSLHVILVTKDKEYSWWGDGYSKKFILSLGNHSIEEFGYNISRDEWHEFKLIKFGKNLYAFFDSKLILKVEDIPSEEIQGVGINSAWCSNTQYDFIEFLTTQNILFSPSNKTYFSFSNYTQIPLDVVA